MARHVILLGPPGAGKGTHARMVSERLGIPHIATGDLLRTHIEKKTLLGKRAKSYVENGKLVPDELVIEMIKARLRDPDASNGFILDGFPRTVEQARVLDDLLAKQNKHIDLALEFKTSEETLSERLSGRRACPNCGTNYHVRNIPPKREGICDSCGSKLVRRKDDHLDTVRERFRIYQEQTAPLIDFYRKRGLLQVVNGDLGIDALQKELANYI